MTDSKQPENKCPFCNSDNIDPEFWVGDFGDLSAGCQDCGASGPYKLNPENALKAFVTRASSEREKKLEEALRNLIKRCEQDIEFNEYARIESTVAESITVLEEE